MNELKPRRPPLVFVPNSGGGHDFSDAERFGTLRAVTEGWVNPSQTGVINRKWQQALKDSLPTDFILVTSLPIIFGIGASLFALKHGRLNLLVFNSKQRYTPRTLHFGKETS
jgi:hypothetical protein